MNDGRRTTHHLPSCRLVPPATLPPRHPFTPPPPTTPSPYHPVLPYRHDTPYREGSRMAAHEFVFLDERFRQCINPTARVRTLFEGCAWAEGPAWSPGWRSLVWSDIPNDRHDALGRVERRGRRLPLSRRPHQRQHRRSPGPADQLRARRPPRQPHRVRRHGDDASPTATRASGSTARTTSWSNRTARSGSPIPPTASSPTTRATARRCEIDGCHVYRVDPATRRHARRDRRLRAAERPRLLARREPPLHRRHRRHPRRRTARATSARFQVDADETLSGGEVFATCTAGFFDGFRLDVDGRIWTSTADGVHVFDPDGTLLGKVLVPEVVANVEFGGAKRNQLFICGTTSLYTVKVMTNGAKRI